MSAIAYDADRNVFTRELLHSFFNNINNFREFIHPHS